jgi:hypothetical protein
MGNSSHGYVELYIQYLLGTTLLAVTLFLLSMGQVVAPVITGAAALVMLGRVLWRVL